MAADPPMLSKQGDQPMRHPAWLNAGILIACAIAAAAPAAAQSAANEPSAPEAQLLATEDARFKAQLAHDAAALDRATASDVVYSHATGKREDKAAAMQTFLQSSFSSIEASARHARVIGDVGIIRGQLVRQLPDRTLNDGYLAVYAMRDGRWQLIEWAAGSPPPSAKGEAK
jgi:hypothetical protein